MSDEADRFLRGSKLSKLLAGRSRPARHFDLEVARDKGAETIKLAVRVLSAQEFEQAQAAAVKWLTATGGWSREDVMGDAGDALLNLEVMVQVLARALVDPENPDLPLAAVAADEGAAEVRRMFDVDEIRACFDEYRTHETERSPFRALKTLADVREVADALGKGLMEPTSLQRYDATTLRLIISALTARARRWMMPSSSDTSPPTSSPDDSSTPSAPPMHTLSVE